jgi:hypothetical protein
MDALVKAVSAIEIDVAKLHQFLTSWDQAYQEKLNGIDLFKRELTSEWSKTQKQFFAKVLYHQRGHFSDVLWYMGNFAPNAKAKEMVLENIRDEFGKQGMSHESLYFDFAKSLGVDLTYELIEEKMYLPFLREYNQGHLRWLRENDWDHRLAAFAALERLDNLDYVNLRNVAISLGASKRDLVFFNVHIHVTHYDAVESIFSELWSTKPDVVMSAFNFIGDYQVNIWKRISDVVFEYENTKADIFA